VIINPIVLSVGTTRSRIRNAENTSCHTKNVFCCSITRWLS